MLLHRNSPVANDEVRFDALVRTHWSLAVCVVCRHEQVRGEHQRATCPGCGAQLRSFALYRDLQAQR